MKGKKMSKRVRMSGFVLLLVVVLITSMGLAEEAKSGIKVEPYVRIKLDASIDSSRTSPGNYVTSVDNQQNGTICKSDDEFNMTARETRLGVNVSGVAVDSVDIGGKIEVDFYGKGSSSSSYMQPDNQALIMLRHAYAELTWPEKHFSLLAGQTCDVISPLVPTTLNYSVLWDCGNIGYRRAQIRGTWDKQLDDDKTLQVQTALTRSIGQMTPLGVAGSTDTESGPDSGLPQIQARVAVTRPLGGPSPATIGVSGHWGREEYDNATVASERVNTWSINVDAVLPVTKGLCMKGEWYTGQNLDTFLGGIGQGVVQNSVGGATNLNEINSMGGWFAAEIGPWRDFSFNVGYGIDDPDNKDFAGATYAATAAPRILNQCIFANAIYELNQYVSMGVEVSKWRTDYMGNGNSDATRAQFSMILKN